MMRPQIYTKFLEEIITDYQHFPSKRREMRTLYLTTPEQFFPGNKKLNRRAYTSIIHEIYHQVVEPFQLMQQSSRTLQLHEACAIAPEEFELCSLSFEVSSIYR